MTEVLSQAEISNLLTKINADDEFDLGVADFTTFTEFTDLKEMPASIEDFESFLTKRKFEPEEVYGTHSFQKAATMCRFFDSKEGETILADIERKNYVQWQ